MFLRIIVPAPSVPLLVFVFHRLYLYPVAKFQGPKLAALTRYYTAWCDVVKSGTFLRHVNVLHDIYGDVIRIGPNEVCPILCQSSHPLNIFIVHSYIPKSKSVW
jgi:hypothetical protein